MTTPSTAAIYTRLSRDPDGTKPNLEAQARRCRALSESRGWGLATEPVYVDRDKTAAGREPDRPAYRRLLDDIRAGRIDGVIALDQDRLVREPYELEQLLHLCEDADLTHVATAEGDLDLSSPRDVMMARIRAAMSADEVTNIRKRVKRKMEDLANEGKLIGGGHRPFGYEADRLTVNQAEAREIRRAVDRVLAGDPLRVIVRDWQARVPSVAGGKWSQYGVKRLLSSPRLAGYVNHHGQPAGRGSWEPIIDLPTQQRVHAILWNPARNRAKNPPRRYFLRGVLMCGTCGTKMIGRVMTNGGNVYTCPPKQDGGCHGVGVRAQQAEDAVGNMIAARLDAAGVDEVLSRHHAAGDGRAGVLADELRQYEDRLEELSLAHYVHGEPPRPIFLKARDELELQIADLRKQLASTDEMRLIAAMPTTPDGIRATWDAQEPEWRHNVVTTLIERIDVMPVPRGTNRFLPERLRTSWR